MTKLLINLTTFLLIIFLGTSCDSKNDVITYSDLLSRMTDLKRIAKLPVEGERSGMFSSYDRKSKYDLGTDSYIDWSANDDGFTPQYIRKEGEDMVLAEMKGPGAIVRIWSASPKSGHVKIYIDGSETPVIDIPFIDYFDTSRLSVFRYPNLVYETNARGFNNYVPITFQKSIKILGSPNWGQYYQFNYITFPEGTAVEEFSTVPSPEVVKELQRVNNILGSKLGKPVTDETSADTETKKLTINPGESRKAFQIEGKRAITGLKVKMKSPGCEKEAEVYRKTILTMKWDGSLEPAVWSPVGDFFGSAPGFNEYKTLSMGMTSEWMYSYWYMPFEKQAVIEFENTSDFPIFLDIEVIHEKLKGNPAEFGRFHAKWHRDIMSVEQERWPDWTVLKTEGRGRFVGMFLSVWNPKGGSCREFADEGFWWWGEGDEKFFVDGEKFPSTFGTGTEDYFGYAWCMPDYFERAFHSQNHTAGNMGHQSLNRWQIIDNVPFQKSFEAYLEKYFPNQWPTQYATVAYWYLDQNGTDPIGPIPAKDLFGYEIPYTVYTIANAVEGENMQVVTNTEVVDTDAFAHESLYSEVSGHKLLVWHAKKAGENVLKTSFDFNQNGKFRVFANMLVSKDGGVFNMKLNGKQLKNNVSLQYNSTVSKTKLIQLGILDMNSGKQELTIEWVNQGNTEKIFALDCLKFKQLK